MRICFVYDALFPYVSGGAQRRNHEISRRLAERHDVHIITWQFWPGPDTIMRDGVTLHGLGRPIAFYGPDGKRTVREAVAFAVKAFAVLMRDARQFDVIDCSANPFIPLYAVWLAARFTRTPLAVTWHELWGQHWDDYLPRRPVVARVARLIESRATRLGSVRVAVSEFTAQRLRDTGIPSARLVVVPNGVSLDRFAPADIGRRPSKSQDVVFVGRLIDEKRVDMLIEAISAARQTLPRIRCAIVGDGPERARLGQLVSELGLQANVSFYPNASDAEVAAHMQSSKVLAFPSEREGFGIVAVEAQAAGCVPVVVNSPYSAAPALIQDQVDGLLCEPDASSLASALVSLLKDRTRRERMRTAALRSADKFDWSVIARRLERVYGDVTASRTRGVHRGAATWP
jgi:glycosyltransferase involved in cell wall biosynthesis